MKLIYCPECEDVVRLVTHHERTCACGQSWGRYQQDGHDAYVGGLAVPLGIANASLDEAVKRQPVNGWGVSFEAFVIPHKCKTIRRI